NLYTQDTRGEYSLNGMNGQYVRGNLDENYFSQQMVFRAYDDLLYIIVTAPTEELLDNKWDKVQLILDSMSWSPQ
ncbi:MAG: hypothetical protein AAFQ07_13840, partial [Chloroflexota bacterium]